MAMTAPSIRRGLYDLALYEVSTLQDRGGETRHVQHQTLTRTRLDASVDMSAPGSGTESDKRCGYRGSFTGVMTSDGTVTSLRFDPPFHFGGCEQLGGSDTLSGKVSSDGSSLTVTASGRWTCVRQFTIPAAGSAEGEMTTLSIQKR
jgi:hypothetical protein